MPLNIELHPTWNVWDSTKVQTFMRCPRKFFFEYVLGWRRDEPNIDFVFGGAWHILMEHIWKNGYGAESLFEGYQLFEAEFRRHFNATLDPMLEPKIPANVMRALAPYANKFAEDMRRYTVLKTEVAGSILIDDEDTPLHFKVDLILQDNETGKFLAMEHKSTKQFSKIWASQWKHKFQIGCYTAVLYCYYPPEEVAGVTVNGFAVRNAPKLKLNGEPIANARDNEFIRVPVMKDMLHMVQWFYEAQYWLAYIKGEFAALQDESPDTPIMSCFPTCTESCSDFNRPCEYEAYCYANPNPLRIADQPPIGFKVEFWDPRIKEETATEVLHNKRPLTDKGA